MLSVLRLWQHKQMSMRLLAFRNILHGIRPGIQSRERPLVPAGGGDARGLHAAADRPSHVSGFGDRPNTERRSKHKLFVTDNLLVTRDDFTRFEIANPCADPGANCATRAVSIPATLPVFNLNPGKRGLRDNFVTNTTTGEDRKEIYNGFEFNLSARLFPVSVFVEYTIGRTIAVVCGNLDNRNTLLFCDGRDFDQPWLDDFQITGGYSLPYGVDVSGSLRSYNPRETRVTFPVPSSAFREAGLNRTQPMTIPLLPPGSRFTDRINQIDLRFMKRFETGNLRWMVQGAIYNLINADSVILEHGTFGGNLDFPVQVNQPRSLQLAVRVAS